MRNGTFAESMVRRQKIAENNQKEAGNQIGKTGKSHHFDNIRGMKTPARIQTIPDSPAGNDGMSGIIADRKTDKPGKNPFKRRKFAPDIPDCQKIIR